MDNHPLSKRKVSDLIIEDFQDRLRDGTLKEGDKLPNLTDYAKQLGVSRLSLREAIQTLEKMGAVVSRPKVGTVIVCGDPDRWVYPLLPNLVKTSPEAMHQLLETRTFFESMLCSICAENRTEESLKSIQQVLQQQRDAIVSGEYSMFYELDTLFHIYIANCCENFFIKKMYSELLQTSNPPVTEILRFIPNGAEISFQAHSRILDAITSGDSVQAAEAARDHMTQTQLLYDKYESGGVPT